MTNQTIYNVQFPKLNLKFKINPIALNFFSIKVHWYGIIIAVGVLLGFIYIFFNAKRFKLNKDKLFDSVFIGLIGGFIGARLYYVAFYPGDTYIKDPIKILYINEGGIAIYGGIIFGILSGLLIAKKEKLNIPAALDIISICFLIGQGIGRWGNFFNQEAFGTPTDNVFGMSSEATNFVSVHPCFLYESVWCLLGFLLLHLFSLKKKRYNGQIFFLYLVWYGVERFFVEGLRTDSLFIPGVNIRISQLVAAITVLISIIILIVFKISHLKTHHNKQR